MRYNKFIIKNFKGIRELVIDLNRPPRSNIFTLVGLNESGKTTILEAMHWLSNPKNYDLISLIPKNKLLNFNGEISVSAEIELSEDEEQVIAGLLYDKHNKFKITEPINRIYISRKYHYTDSNIVNREYSFNTKIIGKTKRMKAPKILKEYEERYKVANDYILNNLLPSIIYSLLSQRLIFKSV